MYKILIVEDDKMLLQQICIALNKYNFIGVPTLDFKDVISIFIKENPNLVLLDINLPFYDGFYWCKKIREISKIPIIFLSSRNSNMDILMALNNGSDDYIVKPFSLDLLIGKIQSVLRRSYEYNV